MIILNFHIPKTGGVFIRNTFINHGFTSRRVRAHGAPGRQRKDGCALVDIPSIIKKHKNKNLYFDIHPNFDPNQKSKMLSIKKCCEFLKKNVLNLEKDVYYITSIRDPLDLNISLYNFTVSRNATESEVKGDFLKNYIPNRMSCKILFDEEHFAKPKPKYIKSRLWQFYNYHDESTIDQNELNKELLLNFLRTSFDKIFITSSLDSQIKTFFIDSLKINYDEHNGASKNQAQQKLLIKDDFNVEEVQKFKNNNLIDYFIFNHIKNDS